MTISIFAVDLKACHKAGSGYRVVAGIDDMASIRRLPTMQANLLAIIVWSSHRDLDWYDFGRLGYEGVGIGVSRVLENIVGNIEEIIVAVNVTVILRTQLPT